MTQAGVRARKIAEQVISKLKPPLRLRNFKGVCQPSIGVAVFGELSVPPHAIFKSASIAMYQAIACGINNIKFCDAVLEQGVMERAKLAEAFHQDLAGDEFVLLCEAQTDLQQQITGVELLPKWHRSQYAELEPCAVFQLAEDSGMGVNLGEWMLAQAADCLDRWSQYPHMAHLEVAVKISRSQFSAANFVENLRALLNKTQVAPRKLKLELDEETLVDVKQAPFEISALKGMGIGITLDDFGNTRASLSSLQKLPIDEIKIERDLVKDVESGSADMAIIKAVVAIGKQRNVGVIAAGLVRQDQKILFEEADCQRFQALHEPMLLQEFEQLSNSGSRSGRAHLNLDSTNLYGWL